MNFIEAVREALNGETIHNPMYRFSIVYEGDEFWMIPEYEKWVPDHRAIFSENWKIGCRGSEVAE